MGNFLVKHERELEHYYMNFPYSNKHKLSALSHSLPPQGSRRATEARPQSRRAASSRSRWRHRQTPCLSAATLRPSRHPHPHPHQHPHPHERCRGWVRRRRRRCLSSAVRAGRTHSRPYPLWSGGWIYWRACYTERATHTHGHAHHPHRPPSTHMHGHTHHPHRPPDTHMH